MINSTIVTNYPGTHLQNQTEKLDLLKTEFEAELKEKTFKLKPRSYGCAWLANEVRKGGRIFFSLFIHDE